MYFIYMILFYFHTFPPHRRLQGRQSFTDLIMGFFDTSNDETKSKEILGSESSQWNHLLLEIVYLYFRDVTPKSVAESKREYELFQDA